MEFYEMFAEVEGKVAEFIDNATKIDPERCGLDKRSGFNIFITEDVIACRRSDDKSLQYYGGFEYVQNEYRSVLGDYVFYDGQDERVQEHIQKWLEAK